MKLVLDDGILQTLTGNFSQSQGVFSKPALLTDQEEDEATNIHIFLCSGVASLYGGEYVKLKQLLERGKSVS